MTILILCRQKAFDVIPQPCAWSRRMHGAYDNAVDCENIGLLYVMEHKIVFLMYCLKVNEVKTHGCISLLQICFQDISSSFNMVYL